MRFNKAKAQRAAEKSLSQGKIAAAIAEYCRIVEQEPNDFMSLNMLGDLYVRTGQPHEASELFARVAEHYRSQGFALKAIAMYKKILRLRPDDLAASSTLAELYAVQGLIVEARAQLLSIADAHTNANRAHDALDTLRRIADLDPHNPEVRLRVAAGYAREGFADESAAAYTEAGERFLVRQSPEAALDAFTEALKYLPFNHAALAGVLAAHAQLGTPDEAAELIEQACENSVEDHTLGELLLRAYLEADDPARAEICVERLTNLRPHEAAYRLQLLEVARLHLKANDADRATAALARTFETALNLRHEAELLEILDEITTRDPEHLAALRLLAHAHTARRDEAMMRQTYERIADAAAAAADDEAEAQALICLLDLAPDMEDLCRERLRALGKLPQHLEPAAVAAAVATSPANDEVPTFESFMLTNDGATFEPTSFEPTTFEPTSFDQPAVANESAVSVADGSFIADLPTSYDPTSSFADLNDDAVDASPAANETSEYQEINWDVSLATPASASSSSSAPTAVDERLAALLAHELESVDFYIAQGYSDVALDTLDMLERQYGAQPAIEERRRQLSATSPSAPSPSAPSPSAPPPSALPVSLASEPTPAKQHHTTAPAFAEQSFAEQSFAAPSFSDSSLDDAIAFDAEAFGGAFTETAPAPPAASAFVIKADEVDDGLAAIFDEFRAAAEEDEPAAVADYDTHYNLGIAYQEMGLLDEAVEEFQKAAGIAAPSDGTPRYLQCCNMLGHCFMQKELPRLAVMWFRKGLEAPGHTEDEYQAMRYELAAAHEAAGERDRALSLFMEVYGINVSYRGVSDKLRTLRAEVLV